MAFSGLHLLLVFRVRQGRCRYRPIKPLQRDLSFLKHLLKGQKLLCHVRPLVFRDTGIAVIISRLKSHKSLARLVHFDVPEGTICVLGL